MLSERCTCSLRGGRGGGQLADQFGLWHGDTQQFNSSVLKKPPLQTSQSLVRGTTVSLTQAGSAFLLLPNKNILGFDFSG